MFNQNFRHHNWPKLLNGKRCLAEWGMAMNCSSYVRVTVCGACSVWRMSKLYDWRNEFLAKNCGVKLRRTKYELSSLGFSMSFSWNTDQVSYILLICVDRDSPCERNIIS